MRTCTVCSHPKRGEIDRSLVGRELSYRAISGRFNVSRSSLYRHKTVHLLRIVREAEEREELNLKGELLAQVEILKARSERILNTAEKAGNLPTALSAIRECRSSIELLLDLRLEEELAEVKQAIIEMKRGYGA